MKSLELAEKLFDLLFNLADFKPLPKFPPIGVAP